MREVGIALILTTKGLGYAGAVGVCLTACLGAGDEETQHAGLVWRSRWSVIRRNMQAG